MFKLHPILSNHHYKLLNVAYDVCTDIHLAPNLELPSHLLASKLEEVLCSQKPIAYGYRADNNDGRDLLHPSYPLYLLLQCEQISHGRFSAIVRTVSDDVNEEMLSESFGIEFTYYGDLEQLEQSARTYSPVLMQDVVNTFEVIEQ